MCKVAYSKGGYWIPSIPDQTCEQCGIVYVAHKKGQRYCGKVCAGKSRAGTKVQHTERTCPGCNKVWCGYPSNPSVYCSKKCIFESGAWERPIEAQCLSCGSDFMAKKKATTAGGRQKYCSPECRAAGQRDKHEKICIQCDKPFTVQKSRLDEVTCSIECRGHYFRRDNHHAWTGGKVLQNQRLFRRIDRDGYQAKYEGEHRLIAAREIGRPLIRGEIVICVDQDNENLSPSNLFLCPNQSEFGLIRQGAVEWPQSSNLESYRVGGYTRPDVRIVLHQWENGQRRESVNGKAITRHPQADEIIKRRKAGATARQLAAEFSTNLSNMASILRRRL